MITSAIKRLLDISRMHFLNEIYILDGKLAVFFGQLNNFKLMYLIALITLVLAHPTSIRINFSSGCMQRYYILALRPLNNFQSNNYEPPTLLRKHIHTCIHRGKTRFAAVAAWQ